MTPILNFARPLLSKDQMAERDLLREKFGEKLFKQIKSTRAERHCSLGDAIDIIYAGTIGV